MRNFFGDMNIWKKKLQFIFIRLFYTILWVFNKTKIEKNVSAGSGLYYLFTFPSEQCFDTLIQRKKFTFQSKYYLFFIQMSILHKHEILICFSEYFWNVSDIMNYNIPVIFEFLVINSCMCARVALLTSI